MKKIQRAEAVNALSKAILISLNNEARESYILNWWGIDEGDTVFHALSKEMQSQILLNDDPPHDIQNPLYDELIVIALCSEYKGVTNKYLSESMLKMGFGEHEVYGDIEPLESCPCCGYRTLSSRANYDICSLCHWEDSGIVDPDTYSGPNHMNLREAKEKFREKMGILPLTKWVKA